MKKTISFLFCLSIILNSLSAGALQEQLSGDLVQLQGDELVPASDALSGKNLVAVYYSAHWCPPCRQFTPVLSDFYDEASEKYPNFQLVFVSSDRDADAMKEYMEWGSMHFPAVKFDEREDSGLNKYAARGIPYLVVLDEDGNQVLGKGPGENWKSPNITLADLKKLLEEQG